MRSRMPLPCAGYTYRSPPRHTRCVPRMLSRCASWICLCASRRLRRLHTSVLDGQTAHRHTSSSLPLILSFFLRDSDIHIFEAVHRVLEQLGMEMLMVVCRLDLSSRGCADLISRVALSFDLSRLPPSTCTFTPALSCLHFENVYVRRFPK